MKKTILTACLLVAAMSYSSMAWADNDVSKEKAEQKTPQGWEAVQLPNIPAITAANTYDITKFGADPSAADNTAAIQKAIDAVDPTAGGMVVIPKGTWLCGPIKLGSKTILHFAKGATLKLLPYGTYPAKSKDDTHESYENFIDVKKSADDIIIEGEDKKKCLILGQGQPWWRKVEEIKKTKFKLNRGTIIRFSQGTRFLVRNLKIQDAPGVNLTVSQNGKGSHATIHDVIIREPASTAASPSHNTDGISVWGPYVNIYNCDISNGDDNVVVDTNGRYVHVWGCKFGDGHGASMGSFTQNMHDILWENISFFGTDAGFRLKSQKGRSGSVYNITFRNCDMFKVASPISIEAWYDKGKKPQPWEAPRKDSIDTTPYFHDILIQNVKSTGTEYDKSPKHHFPIYLYGLPESYIRNVTFDNVQVQAGKGMFMAFCAGIKFINGCAITNTTDPSKMFETKYDAEVSGKY